MPHVQVVNLYGSTEIGTTAALKLIERGSNPGQVSIGKPVANADIYMLDSQMNQVSREEIGEIYVGAPHLARGYLNNTRLTAERFMLSPFVAGERLCRTGDLGRYLSNGEIEFLGRADLQVKVRGFRIELQEIELALQAHEDVREAVVVAREAGSDKQLIAYVVPSQGPVSREPELRRYLKERLPYYMCPSKIVFVDQLPVTSAGKVDRGALSSLNEVADPLTHEFPSDPVETRLAAVWRELLNMESLAMDRDFYELGGDSLLAVRLVFRIAEEFDIEIFHSHLPEPMTIRSLSRIIGNPFGDSFRASEPIATVSRNSTLRPSITQQSSLAHQLRGQLRSEEADGALTGFAFSLNGTVSRSVLEEAVNVIISRHEILRTGFMPVAMVGALAIQGWKQVRELFRQSPVKPTIHFRATVRSSVSCELDEADLTRLTTSEQKREIRRIGTQVVVTPHDYTVPPLLRGTLVTLASGKYQLLFGVSHLVFDGWSRNIFQSELAAACRYIVQAKPKSLRDIPIQYLDYAEWQRERLKGEHLRKLLSFWERQYLDFSPLDASDLPFAQEVPAGHIDEIKSHGIELPPSICEALKLFVSTQRHTLYTVFVAAQALALHFYTQRERICMSTFVANRVHPSTEHLIGDFAIPHILGILIDVESSLGHFVKYVREVVLDVSAHQEIPTDYLMSILSSNQTFRNRLSGFWRGRLPIVCELVNGTTTDMLPEFSISSIGLPANIRSAWPLKISWQSIHGKIWIFAMYQEHRFETSGISDLLYTLQLYIEWIVTQPNAEIRTLAPSVTAAHNRRAAQQL